jgi:hypothetical protein
MTQTKDFPRRRKRATSLPFLPFRTDDEDLNATSDYFWMLRSGVLEEHTAGAWQTFRAAYTTMGEHLRQGQDDGPPRQYAA